MRKTVLFTLILVMLLSVQAVKAGYIAPLALAPSYAGYTSVAAKNVVDRIYASNSNNYRGFAEFDTTSIPDNSTIDRVDLYIYARSTYTTVVQDAYLTKVTLQPSVTAAAALYADITTPTTYITLPNVADANAWFNVTLAGSSAADLQALLAANWFAVGFDCETGPAGNTGFDGTTGNSPILTVWYRYTGIDYVFSSKYENNTDVYPLTVTILSDSGADTVTLTASTTLGFTNRPTYFTWEVSAGIFRRIYATFDSGAVSLFTPESTFTTYQIIPRDYTGSFTVNQTYVTSSRVIGGSEQVVEKVRLDTLLNTVPLFMVNNRNYFLTLNTPDASSKSGVLTVSASPTITLPLVVGPASKMLQLTTGSVQVGASRTSPAYTTLWGNFTETQGRLCNVTVTIRNFATNAVVNSTSVVNTASFTYDWTTATNTTNYKLAMVITHPVYGALTYSKPLAGLRVNPAAPSLAGLGSITGPGGAVNMTHMFGTLIMLVVAGAFTYRNVVGGIMAMVVSGSFLAYIGWIPTSTVIISGVAFIAIVAAANRSGG